MSDDPRAEIAARQADLVAALVAGGAPPAGVDAHRVAVAAEALLRKRTGEVAGRWPGLLAGADARARFVDWARHRPRRGSFTDGWEFALHLERQGALDDLGAAELRAARAHWRRDANGIVRPRRLWSSPRVRWSRGG